MEEILITKSGGGRSSNFELLRLVAQYFIVYYHLLLICVTPFSDNPIFKALEIPTHIGVILFVLISGYFGIRPTSKGLMKLLFIFLIYSIPEIFFKVKEAESLGDLGKSFFFFSHTHFWFIRTYLFLYIVSPMINMFIEKSTGKQRMYMICALFFISIYVGTVGSDPSLEDGKNVANFIFIYMVGHALKTDIRFTDKIETKFLLVVFLILNMLLVSGYYLFSDHLIGKVLWRLSFPYSSPILLLNSIMFFIFFSRMSFQSKTVNWLAQSSLAIYLIHGNRPLFLDWSGNAVDSFPGGIIGYMVELVRNTVTTDLLFGLSLLVIAILVIVMCIGIDKVLSPLWKFATSQFNRLYTKIGF